MDVLLHPTCLSDHCNHLLIFHQSPFSPVLCADESLLRSLTVAARGEIGREGCEISSLVEHMGLSPWLFL